VITLFRCPPGAGATPGVAESLEPGIGCRAGTWSSCSFTMRIVEPVRSLCRIGGGLDRGRTFGFSPDGGGLNNGGTSELPLPFNAIDEDLLTRFEPGSEML